MGSFQNGGSFQESGILAEFPRASYPVTLPGSLRNTINHFKIAPRTVWNTQTAASLKATALQLLIQAMCWTHKWDIQVLRETAHAGYGVLLSENHRGLLSSVPQKSFGIAQIASHTAGHTADVSFKRVPENVSTQMNEFQTTLPRVTHSSEYFKGETRWGGYPTDGVSCPQSLAQAPTL